MINFLKIYLPLFLLLYLLVAFVLPSYRTWKQTGINPIRFGKDDTLHNYIGFVMKQLVAFLFVPVILFSSGSKLYAYLLPAWYLQNQTFLVTGLIVIHIALFWIIIAQYQMSNSWRIGIDEVNKTDLVTKGVFRISRNPIFLGMILTVLGLFFILPNALNFFLSLTTYFIIQVQIRLEETFLEQQHGEVYKNYKSKTRRLI
ncbi:MAG: isoprenylcysteine carboxylmethyltransferase family protein [Ferruginibacter sp.]|nr:isoprenylcysteine carboxylmethyltransferase family protein [Ferruginibacter sp.]